MTNNTETLVLQFLETAAALERRLDRALSFTKGVSFSEYRLLRSLSQQPEHGYSRIDLAHSVGLTASAVTRALRPLEKIGYVTTKRNQRDARQSLAVITAAGRELVKDAQDILRGNLRALPISGLSDQKMGEFQKRLSEFGDR